MRILVGNYHCILGVVKEPLNDLIYIFAVIYGNFSSTGKYHTLSFYDEDVSDHCMNPFKGTAQLVQKVTLEPMMDFK